MQSLIKDWLQHWQDKRLASVFLFGVSSGFPWVLIGSVMSAWLKDEGLSRSTIGLFGLVFAVYSVNFLWSPLLDAIKLPWLNKRLGLRRSWILLTQALMLVATLWLSTLTISNGLFWAALCCFCIALASSTQDIAIDAYRIDVFAPEEGEKLSAAASMATAGWWTGYALLGAVPFFLAEFIAWQHVYGVLAVVMALLMIATLVAKQPDNYQQQAQAKLGIHIPPKANWSEKCRLWLMHTLVTPFAQFFKTNGVKLALSLLAFIFLFKIGEAFLARMSIVFYKEIGYSNADIALFSKLGTGLLTIVFALAGGLFNQKYGIVKGLFVSGVAMAASNLIFALIAVTGPSLWLYGFAIVVDGFTQAWSLVAMVAFISMLCDRAFSATHYALLASIGNLGRTLVSGYSGVVVDDWLHGNWALFFILTAVMVIPSLCFLWFIRGTLNELEAKHKKTAS